jgi:hypothetical protein
MKNVKMKHMGIILVAALTLVLVSSPLAFCGDFPVEKEAGKKAGQMTDGKKQAASFRPQEREEKGGKKGQTPVASPTSFPGKPEKQPGEIAPAQPQKQDLSSAPAAKEKGRQIKWQIVCTGGACGNNNQAKRLVLQDFWAMCGSAGQTAVGPGSSSSFGMNSGYWQETLYGFLRGDANGDGIIDMSDAIYLLNYLFKNGPEPDPYALGDANSDGEILVEDAIFLLNYILRGGPAPEDAPIGRGSYSSVSRNSR